MQTEQHAVQALKPLPDNTRFVAGTTFGLLAVGFLMLLLIVGATIWLGERAQSLLDDVVRARNTRTSAVELRNAVLGAESSQRGYLATSNEIYLAPYGTAKALAERELANLDTQLSPQGNFEPLVRRLKAVVADKIIEMDRTIALKNEQRADDALAILRTNRGKALMDETNLLLAGVIRTAEERLTKGATEQQANAAWLRLISILGAGIIVLVVAIVVFMVSRHTREIARTRDEVNQLNASLEERVQSRTTALAGARDRAELLLAEVNHRVANSLSLVASMVRMQSNVVSDKAAKSALSETEGRIFAISFLHKRLYSSNEVGLVSLDEYLAGLLRHLETAMQDQGHGGSLRYELDPLHLETDKTVNLGVIVTELVTNAFKYAYPSTRGEVRVSLKRLPEDQVELVVEDDGIGRQDGAPSKGTGLGTRIVKAMAAAMNAEIHYLSRLPGTSARLTFPLKPA